MNNQQPQSQDNQEGLYAFSFRYHYQLSWKEIRDLQHSIFQVAPPLLYFCGRHENLLFFGKLPQNSQA